MTETYEGLDAVTVFEEFQSGGGSAQTTRFQMRAPDRMAYRILESTATGMAGTEGIVIGDRRWDRLPGGDWLPSTQAPLVVPRPLWTDDARNAFRAGPGELTFFDPTLDAWYRLRYDPASGRMLELRMTAASHFMEHTYSGFDRPVPISPPSR